MAHYASTPEGDTVQNGLLLAFNLDCGEAVPGRHPYLRGLRDEGHRPDRLGNRLPKLVQGDGQRCGWRQLGSRGSYPLPADAREVSFIVIPYLVICGCPPGRFWPVAKTSAAASGSRGVNSVSPKVASAAGTVACQPRKVRCSCRRGSGSPAGPSCPSRGAPPTSKWWIREAGDVP